ncbi:MAG: glutathione S-transferase family protein [Alphaproteobacteria bacterium]
MAQVMAQADLIFYYAPQSRSLAVNLLLDELGAPYERRVLILTKNEQRQPAYLAINPMGKVPAIVHKGAVITEQSAIFIYLPDAFPQKGLAPAIGDPLRGPYLRWIVFYAACLEPAVADKAAQHTPMNPRSLGYGDYDTVIKTVEDQLAPGPYLLGDRFTAADILWGTALNWLTKFKMVPETPVIAGYVKRMEDRLQIQKRRAEDAELVASQH